MDVAEYLARDDKWYVAGGLGSMYAPEFPRYLHAPGFWDEVFHADQRIEHLYTILLLDAGAKPITIPCPTRRRWRPDRFTQTYEFPDFDLIEERVIIPDDVFITRMTVRNKTQAPLKISMVLWGVEAQHRLKTTDHFSVSEVENHGRSIGFRFDRDLKGGPISMYFAYGADRDPVGISATLSEPSNTEPSWRVPPFREQIVNGKLCNCFAPTAGIKPFLAQLHIGMQYDLDVPAQGSSSITMGCAVSFDNDKPKAAIARLQHSDAIAQAEREWQAYFAQVPHFTCSDPYLQAYYWYRWYGLKLLTVNVRHGNYQYPCVYEGTGYFRRHIAYSAMCHMYESRWMHNPALAEGSLLGIAAQQEASGRIPGAVNINSHEDYIYHANWGHAVLEVYRLYRNRDFLAKAYLHLRKYAEWFLRERDPEHSQLYDVIDQDETGQEYSSRYMAVHPEADLMKPIRLKGVDATVYQYELQKAVSEIAEMMGDTIEAGRWQREAEHTKRAVNSRMWDLDTAMYYDCDARTLNRIAAKPSTSFYPFLTDIAGVEQVAALRKHLLNPREFWTEYPVPSVSIDDPYFEAEPNWKGKRHSCPWSGRTWPMTNSHIVDALARVGRTLDPEMRMHAVELMNRFITMMFHDRDVNRPNCYEHYNPHTGQPSEYRGYDDYQHSWVVDLIIKHVAGLLPQDNDTLVVDPLPFGLDEFTLDNVAYRGHDVRIVWRAHQSDGEPIGLTVYVDGKQAAHSDSVQALQIPV